MPEVIPISFNKKKVFPFVAGSLFFGLAGMLILLIALNMKDTLVLQIFLILLGVVSVLFFGLVAIVMLPKLLSNQPGLILSDQGLTDASSGVSAGFIAWSEIRKINYSYSGNNTFLVVQLKHPEQFMRKQTNPLKKLAMRLNNQLSGSPVHILVSPLDIEWFHLDELIAGKRFQNKKDPHIES